MSDVVEVGDLVESRENPDWGVGQVQSVIRGTVTVNFEHQGKVVLTGAPASLRLVRRDWS